MKLHPYQVAAVDFLQSHPRAALWLDMGLGKTASVLSALQSDNFPALVTAPPRVVRDVWPEEAAKWRPDLRVTAVMGNPDQRKSAWLQPSDVYVVSSSLLQEAVKVHKWRTLVLDEASTFKNRSSRRWKAARAIATLPSCRYVWQMTGTPSPNGLLDLWAQVYLLDKGERLGRTLGAYRERYFTAVNVLPNGVVAAWAPRPGAPERIHSLLEDVALSMGTEGRLSLPPQTYNTIPLDLGRTARSAYSAMHKRMVVDLTVLGGVVHTAQTAATVSNRLSQITAGFIYDDEGTGGYDILHRDKTSIVGEIAEENNGSPVLVFYRFQAEREMMHSQYPTAVHIDEPEAVQRWDRGEIPILLAHPAGAGHGLNLQHGGHTIVWTSLPWNLEHWEQANKRLLRQGQMHPVVVHTLEAKGTIDRDIRRVLDRKGTVQSALMGHLESLV